MGEISQTKKIGFSDASALSQRLEERLERWDSYMEREKKYRELGEGKTIPLLYNRENADSFIPEFHRENRDLWDLVRPVLREIERNQGSGYWCRAILVKLEAGGKIAAHVDPGWPFCVQRRFHWVVGTNEKVVMICNGVQEHFGLGEIWTFNNKLPHAVMNGGEMSRVHLIADYCAERDFLENRIENWVPSADEAKRLEVTFRYR